MVKNAIEIQDLETPFAVGNLDLKVANLRFAASGGFFWRRI